MSRESKYHPVWQWPFRLIAMALYVVAESYVNWVEKHL